MVYSVCRQIYNECCLIPYPINTLVFRNHQSFSKFIKARTSAQLQAIVAIGISIPWVEGFYSPNGMPTLSTRAGVNSMSIGHLNLVLQPSLLEKFKGLKIFSLKRQIQFGKPMEPLPRTIERAWAAEGFFYFLRSSSDIVTVLITNDSVGMEATGYRMNFRVCGQSRRVNRFMKHLRTE
jgi:hypothetical protein